MIDSIILGTPCISIVKKEFKYNQVDTPHFYKVQKEGIFIEAKNVQEIINKIVEFKDKNLSEKMQNL